MRTIRFITTIPVLALAVGWVFAESTSDLLVNIVVSPNVVNLESQGTWVRLCMPSSATGT